MLTASPFPDVLQATMKNDGHCSVLIMVTCVTSLNTSQCKARQESQKSYREKKKSEKRRNVNLHDVHSKDLLRQRNHLNSQVSISTAIFKKTTSEEKENLDSQNSIWRLPKTLCATEHLL